MFQLPYVVETSRVDLAAIEVEAAEWREIESEHIRCPHSGYLIPKPNRESRGIMYWTGTGCGNRTRPNYPAAIARYEKKRGR